jgi:hypothetical protein
MAQAQRKKKRLAADDLRYSHFCTYYSSYPSNLFYLKVRTALLLVICTCSAEGTDWRTGSLTHYSFVPRRYHYYNNVQLTVEYSYSAGRSRFWLCCSWRLTTAFLSKGEAYRTWTPSFLRLNRNPFVISACLLVLFSIAATSLLASFIICVEREVAFYR